ncbi:MAG: hypothetical protein KatS3mg105_4638 [Gemmatales bacterium]|nr:MAG: hypothetical protein KatS3mg105_4638 [Gemmatales bacterium]
MKRKGLTITEMLVSLALILFIMAILSEAFVSGLGSFRQLRAIGDMDQKLRAAAVILRNDLRADHFNAPPLKLSTISISPPPTNGFFWIAAPPVAPDGVDSEGIPSYIANNHALHFSVNLGAGEHIDTARLKRPENYFVAVVPGNLAARSPIQFRDGSTYRSQHAEVAYFLRPNGWNANGTPLYALYRKQAVLLEEEDAKFMNSLGLPGGAWPQYFDVSCKDEGGTLHFHTIEDVANPNERSLTWPTPFRIFSERGENPNLRGADILLTDVIGFTVRVFPDKGSDFQFIPNYDTGNSPPFPIRAIEITLRVWDMITEQSRQITIIQDM